MRSERPEPPVHDIGEWCGPGGRHLPVVVTTRPWREWFRLRYLVLCFECDLRRGPFGDRGTAERQRQLIESFGA
jgi:hypothetical protein